MQWSNAVAFALIRHPRRTKAPVWWDGRSEIHIVLAGLASASSCDPLDFATIDAKVMERPIAHAAQFGDRLTILDPIVECACDVHDQSPFLGFRSQLPVRGASISSMSLIYD